MDIWSVLILISIAHSIFVVILVATQGSSFSGSRNWLLGILMTLIWFQVEFLSIRWPINLPVYFVYGTRYGAWLVLGPLVYHYIRSVAGRKFNRSDAWHFLPFGVAMLLPVFLSGEELSFRQMHYGMLTPFDHRPDQVTLFQYFYTMVFVGQFVHLGYYIQESRLLLVSYHNHLRQEISSFQESYRWLNIFLVGIAIIMITVATFIVFLFYTGLYRRHFDYMYVLPITVLVYLLSYRLYNTKWDNISLSSRYSKSGLKDQQRDQIKAQLHSVLKENRLYLNKQFRLDDLAKATDFKSHHISEVLNSDMNITFFDLVNQYRIEEAKRLMEHYPNYTLLQIAYESGFNNKTSFVNSFKKFENRTPSNYFKMINA